MIVLLVEYPVSSLLYFPLELELYSLLAGRISVEKSVINFMGVFLTVIRYAFVANILEYYFLCFTSENLTIM